MVTFEPEIQEYFANGSLPIDNELIYAMDKVPAELRVKTITKLVSRHSPAKTIIRICTQLTQAKDFDTKKIRARKNESPITIMSGEKESRIMKVLAESNSIPQWKLLETAAKQTCEGCVLGDSASMASCRECPAVDLLKRLRKLSETAPGIVGAG